MPELSRFKGIIIKMIYRDDNKHSQPHIHVYYGEYEASISIEGKLLAGSLPVHQFRLLSDWLTLHEVELYSAWNKAIIGEKPGTIDPLP